MRTRALFLVLLCLLLSGALTASSKARQMQLPVLEARPPETRLPRIIQQARSTPAPLPGAASRWSARYAAQPTRTATYYQPVSPTRTPFPSQTWRLTQTVPVEAQVKDIYGYGQLLPLSCESRSAADWARHFGVTIHELEFFQKLPKSSNPEEGFVGDPKGGWGNIPPGPYGVHAEPVAKLLKTYGLQARAVRNMRFADLQAEVAAGRPVIVWVTGHVEPGKGQAFKVADGKTVTVARYEHTVIVIGYDEKRVTILDGKTIYERPVETFLKAWSPLENMAIMWNPNAGRRQCDPLGAC